MSTSWGCCALEHSELSGRTVGAQSVLAAVSPPWAWKHPELLRTYRAPTPTAVISVKCT